MPVIPSLDPGAALDATTSIVALAVVLQTAELWAIRGATQRRGVWAWSTIRAGLATSRWRGLADVVFGDRGVATTLALRGAAAFVAPWLAAGPLRAALLALVLLTTLLVAVRWRGSFNGGSDAMTVHLLVATTIHAAAPDDTVARGCAWYVAIVAVHSYVLAGVAKVVHRPWRTGVALAQFVRTAVHRAPIRLLQVLERRPVARALAWGLIGFELSAVVALADPRIALPFIAIAAAFHVANAWVLGLSRFVLPWIATYPALYACSGLALS